MMLRRLLPLLTALGCGSGTSPTDAGVPPVDCPTHDRAEFELGTGQAEFEPITDGQRLQIAQGTQGACHFFLSVRTDGFAARRFKLQYELFYAESSTTTGSRSSFTVRLRPVEGMAGTCENVGNTAFLIQPWKLEDERLIFEVNVTDDEGRTATQRKTVIAEWPAALGVNDCGPRN